MDKNSSIKEIFSIVAPRIDLLNRIFSLGLDSLWRKRLIFLSGIKVGDRVLDACTGTGEVALLIEKKVRPSGAVTGVDFCEEMLEIAMRKTNSHKKNISFILSDARTFPFPDNTFNVVTVAFGMRNITDTVPALREIKRVIKPGGRFFCLELTRPEKKWVLPLYKLYVFKIIPFLGKIAVKSGTPYMYLPRSIDAFYPPEEFKGLIQGCGFQSVTVNSMSFGVATIYGAIKGEPRSTALQP